jgi:hypothetical protein
MEQGTKNLLIFSSIIALGGLGYFLFSKRNQKALNVYSVGKSSNGNLYLFFTTKSASAINKFIEESNPNQAIQELKLGNNPTISQVKKGTQVKISGMEGLDGTHSVLGTLSPNNAPNRVMAVLIEQKDVPSTFKNIPNAVKERFYADSAQSVGKIIIK